MIDPQLIGLGADDDNDSTSISAIQLAELIQMNERGLGECRAQQEVYIAQCRTHQDVLQLDELLDLMQLDPPQPAPLQTDELPELMLVDPAT